MPPKPPPGPRREPVPCPFQPAPTLNKRHKIFLWGDSGVGKTTLALQFPAPAVIDNEGGTDLFAERFGHHVFRCSTADEVMGAVTWLANNENPFRTLVLDSFSPYWDSLQRKWSGIFLARNQGSKGYRHEFYDFQPRDWMTIKSELRDLLRVLSQLDMHIVLTAREKILYADNSFMRAAGVTHDGEKSLPYLFDSVLHLFRDDKGRYMARVIKDRTGLLPTAPFESSYTVFEKAFGFNLLAPTRADGIEPEQPGCDVDRAITTES